ncbi:hypothetical protein [Streptomyces rimosus]|uniref:hypothetical protein n=1 Tax=Streptomyces rimosus TaxID=1927 RepID=UPI0004C02054|nr:hypothetical protein [Streptomyces rimosus]
MTTEPRVAPLHSVDLAARVTTLLARSLPEYVPGVVHEGFRVESLDTVEPRRMFVRWHGGTPTRPVWTHGPALGREKYKAQIVERLTAAGFAVTSVPGRTDVFVDDRPHDTSSPRFAPVASDIPVTAPWLVMDSWTRVHVATADTEEEAAAEAMHAERRHILADACMATAPKLWDALERADEILGDGLAWLRREVREVTGYGPLVQYERIDALVDVANVLLYDEVESTGRMVAYSLPEEDLYHVQWVPKSTTPAVGRFPEWRRHADVDAAIALLADAGLRLVRYGESIGKGSYLCEETGLMVSAVAPSGEKAPGVCLSEIGTDDAEERERAGGVLRAAGWRVEPDTAWPGHLLAYPPAK